MLKKGVGRNSLNVYLSFWRVPSESIFSFTRGRIYLNSSGLKAQVPLVQDSFRFFTRSLARYSPHLFTATSLFKTDILYLYFPGGRRCHFRLRVLANHLASIFFLPLSGDSFGLLSLSPGHRVQTSVGFHSDLKNWPWFLFLS